MSRFFNVSGSFRNLKNFLERMKNDEPFKTLDALGQEGVVALQAYTPERTGVTATSWSYEIVDDGDQLRIAWNNSNINQGVNIAVIIQYGHGTGTGGYVVGRDYINPALQPVFDKIQDRVWKAVTNG